MNKIENKMASKDIKTMVILMFLCILLYNLGHPATPGLIELRELKKSISGEFLATMSASMFLSSPYLGALADTLGMKKIFIFMPLLYGIAQIFFGFSTLLPMMFLARVVAGFASGGTYAVAFGYVSQISKKEKKAKNIAKISSAAIIGGAIGQKIGGMVALIDTRYPFALQAICGLAVSLLILVSMKEIIKVDKTNEKEKKNLNPLSTFKYISELDSYSKFFCFIIFLSGVGIFSYANALNYFLKFNVKVSPNTIGTFVMFSSLVAFFGTSVLLGKLVKKYKEISIYKVLMFIGLIVMAGILTGIVYNDLKIGLMIYGLMAVYNMIYEIIRSLGNTIIAKKYKEKQGKILGVVSAVSFLGNAVGSLFSGYLRTMNAYFPFIVNIIIISIVLILMQIGNKK